MTKPPPCKCDAYPWPHRQGSGNCGRLEREAEAWRIYYERRGLVTSEQRRLHDSGHSDGDFGKV